MTEAGRTAEDFVFEMWAYQFPKVAISMFLFWLVYLWQRNPGLVDVAYVVNHFIVGTSLFVYVAP